MSSSPTSSEIETLIAELGKFSHEPLQRDMPAEAVATLLADFRGLFVEGAEQAGAGVRELARRLQISPASVSRVINSSKDMKISTISLLASAIDSYWHIELRKMNIAKSEEKLPFNYFISEESNDARLIEAKKNSALTTATTNLDRISQISAVEYV